MATDLLPLPALADRIDREHRQFEDAMKAGASHAAEAGRLLLEVKRRVPHGGWLPWLAENVKFSERTAQGYMKLARFMAGLDGSKAQHVSHLPYREALAMLAEPRAETDPFEPGPEAVREKAGDARSAREVEPWTLDDAVEALGAKVYQVSRRWPQEYLGAMVSQLRDLADELHERGELCQ